MSRIVTAAALAALLAASACGSGGGTDADAQTRNEDADRIVDVEMVDHEFRMEALGTVNEGDTITFRFTNAGSEDHEAFIGDAAEQLAYTEGLEKITKAHAGGEAHTDDGHDDHPEGSIHLAPGESGELTYTFGDADEVEIACYEAGHYEAGMKLTIQPQ